MDERDEKHKPNMKAQINRKQLKLTTHLFELFFIRPLRGKASLVRNFMSIFMSSYIVVVLDI
jgi:hypothetical protein